MRNKYKGTCYRCGQIVNPSEGHFERHNGSWRTQHADCCIKNRFKELGQPEKIIEYECEKMLRGTKVNFRSLVYLYNKGLTMEEIAERFPSLSVDQVTKALEHYVKERAAQENT